ncbi:leucine-rich_repeat domain-containing protein [Hexamita inflata]|uniref:Leucine-rich repeat domain-containing protein n=1 Tax=Hexamita inflata TaxID=28002 RepID=A0AA86N974_9EUKA|nr:leucine-rich repeat domain-containing protein [Hexamita inflata]
MKNFQFAWISYNYTISSAAIQDFQKYLGDNFGSESAAKKLMETQTQDQTNNIIDDIKYCHLKQKCTNFNSLTIKNEAISNIQFADILNLKDLVILNCYNIQFVRTPEKITALTINDCGIYNVVGIEKMHQLVSLNLNNNNILIIEQVAFLKQLSSFSAEKNYILDIFNLSQQFQLSSNNQKVPSHEVYQCYFNSINQNISVQQLLDQIYDKYMIIKYKTHIKQGKLTIKNDPELKTFMFTDQLDVVKLQIILCQNVSFERTPSKVKNLSLRGQYWNNSNLERIDGIEKMVQLEQLQMCYYRINNIQPLEALKELQILSLKSNNISDVSPLENLTNLQKLDLWQNAISDIQSLKNLKNLKKVDLRRNQITNFYALSDHPNRNLYDIDKK